jgi:PAS domain S-box-containing protein
VGALDFRTVFTGYVVSTMLCALVVVSLWLRTRRSASGLGFWVANLAMQSVALLLILLRGVVPDLVSIVVANTLVIGGLVLLLMGLERYLDRIGPQVQNFVLLAVFALVHTYFTIGQDNLQARNINISVAIAFVCAQAVWLLLRRVGRDTRADTRVASVVFGAYVALSIARIGADLAVPGSNELFRSGLLDTLAILSYQMLQISLTFTLVMMVNRRLLSALERDVSERRLVEEALRRSEEKLSVAFENIPDAIVVTSVADGMVVEVNQAFCEMAGLSRDQALGATTIGLGVWADTADRDRYVEGLRAHGQMAHFETTFRRSTGEVFPGSAAGGFIEVGGERFALTVVHDLTEVKRAEAALRESEERHRTTLETAMDGFWLADAEGRLLEVNEAYCRMSGYSAQELLAMSIPDLESTESAAATGAHMQNIMAKGEDRFESRHRRKDGSVFDVAVNVQYRPTEGGRFVAFLQDITERKQAEEALHDALAQARRFREALDQVSAYIYMKNRQHQYVYANRLTLELYDRTAEELAGSDATPFFPPDAVAHLNAVDDRVIEHGEHTSEEIDFVDSDGNRRVYWEVKTPVYGEADGGEIWGLVGVSTDITERKQAEEALSVAMRDLERSNKDLEQFAYVASHDLQEPLRMVASYTELLRKRYQGKLDADADDFIGFAVDGAIRMQHLLEDLLDYSRVGTRGKAPEPVSSQAALDEALHNLRGQIADSKAEVNSGKLPMVMADETQLMRVFQNLIGNAIKFRRPDSTPHVELSAERSGDLWRFCVADDGIGVAPQDRERIFEIFTRTHLPGEYPGTGIGLSVCRRIVERLGGSIWVETSGDTGTTLCFTLPAAE